MYLKVLPQYEHTRAHPPETRKHSLTERGSKADKLLYCRRGTHAYINTTAGVTRMVITLLLLPAALDVELIVSLPSLYLRPLKICVEVLPASFPLLAHVQTQARTACTLFQFCCFLTCALLLLPSSPLLFFSPFRFLSSLLFSLTCVCVCFHR